MSIYSVQAVVQPNEYAVQSTLERAMEVTENSLTGLFGEVMQLNARLEASERQTREISAMTDAKSAADAEEISALRAQIETMNNTSIHALANAREENEKLKQTNAQLKKDYKELVEALISLTTITNPCFGSRGERFWRADNYHNILQSLISVHSKKQTT